jgi:DNA primase
MTDFVRQLKDSVNIVEVVGEYVRLKKTGSNHMGLCPFHGERSPSFSVSEKKGIYHCFGCQKGGDAISFVQEIQAVSFHEAIRVLAARFGVKVPPEFRARGNARAGVPTEDKLEVYYKLNRFVAQFYHEKLLSPAGEAAREYLEGRGITEATMRSAYLGYAPAAWSELYDFLESKKAPLDKAEELGLIRRKNAADASGRAHYDLFRDRVMFPVTDSRGRVIAFGGRMLADGDGPKYMNSTESPVFHKGSHLFGLFQAQKDIRAEDQCVVVEGFMDCVTLHQAGIGNVVATLGTALTEKHVATLKRLTRNIVVLFDGDDAGREAQTRAMETFLNEDVVASGVSLPDSYDPDEYVKEKGVDALRALIRAAPPLLDQRILDLAAQAGAHSEQRARAADELLPLVSKISSDTARLVRLGNISTIFGVSLEVLERRVRELRAGAPKRATSTAPRILRVAPTPQPGAPDPLDIKLVELLITRPWAFRAVGDFETMLEGLESESTRVVASRLHEAMVSSADATDEVLALPEAAPLRAVITGALVRAGETAGHSGTDEERADAEQELKDLERKLLRRGLERRKERKRAEILKAEATGDKAESARLMNELTGIVRENEALK